MISGYVTVNIIGVKFNSLPLDNPCFLFVMSLPITYSVLFYITLLSVCSRLKAINDCLVFNSTEMSSWKSTDFIQRSKLVMKLCDKFHHVITSIHKLHVFSFVISLLNFLVITILVSFLCYDILIHNLSPHDVILFFGGCGYILCIGIICTLIIINCAHVKAQHDNIMDSMMNLHHTKIDKNICRFLQLMYLQMNSLRNEVSCGLFGFKFSYLMIFLTSVFNYVVVMIQFDTMIRQIDLLPVFDQII
jgi:hypothetical protein